MNPSIRQASLGPRAAAVDREGRELHFQPTLPVQVARQPLFVANSHLIVVKAFLEASDLDRVADELGLRVRYVESPWSDEILRRCDNGDIDLCVFNRVAIDEHVRSNPNSGIELLGDIGHSMGGKNFSVIVRAGHSLADVPLGELAASLRGHRIYVGRRTDRFRNLTLALGVTEDELVTSGVAIINVNDPDLGIFSTDPEAIVVGGQNTRFHAHLTGGFHELIPYPSLSVDVQRSLLKSATNSLIAGPLLADKLDIALPDLFTQLMDNFAGGWRHPGRFDQIVSTLVQECDFGENSNEDRETITRHVLYETYRMGMPVW